MDGTTASATLDGHRIVYDVHGDGDRALVFVHGGSSERGVWHRQVSALRDAPLPGRRVVTVDLLGHGDSDAPEVDYTMDLLAAGVAAVLDDLAIERAVLVGHSNGVPVVRQFHRRYGARVEALVLVDGSVAPMLSPAMADWMRATLERPDSDDFLQQMVEAMPVGQLADADVEAIRAAQLATPRHVMKGSIDALSDPAIWEQDPLDVPVLAVLVAGQPHAAQDKQDLLRRLAPEVELHVWSDVTHFLMLERPAAFHELLVDFVGRVDADG